PVRGDPRTARRLLPDRRGEPGRGDRYRRTDSGGEEGHCRGPPCSGTGGPAVGRMTSKAVPAPVCSPQTRRRTDIRHARRRGHHAGWQPDESRVDRRAPAGRARAFLGGGKALFKDVKERHTLKFVGAKPSELGLVRLTNST